MKKLLSYAFIVVLFSSWSMPVVPSHQIGWQNPLSSVWDNYLSRPESKDYQIKGLKPGAKEIVSERWGAGKAFQLPNGAKQYIVHSADIHYRKGFQWHDIEMTFHPIEDQKWGYQTKGGIFDVQAAEDFLSEELYLEKIGRNYQSQKPSAISLVTVENDVIKSKQVLFEPQESKAIIENEPRENVIGPAGKVIYEDAFGEGIDFELRPGARVFQKLVRLDSKEALGLDEDVLSDENTYISVDYIVKTNMKLVRKSSSVNIPRAKSRGEMIRAFDAAMLGLSLYSGNIISSFVLTQKDNLKLFPERSAKSLESKGSCQKGQAVINQGEFEWQNIFGQKVSKMPMPVMFHNESEPITGKIQVQRLDKPNFFDSINLYKTREYQMLVLFPLKKIQGVSFPLYLDPETIYSETSDGYVQGQNAAYSTARNTSTANNTGLTYFWVGQAATGIYSVQRSYLDFDTSSISGNVSGVNMYLNVDSDFSSIDFNVRIHKYTWSEPIGAGNAESNYDGALSSTYDNDWRNSSGISVDTYYASNSLDASWLNLSGDTKYALLSEEDVNNSNPGGLEYLNIHSADNAGTTADPYLSVDAAPFERPSLELEDVELEGVSFS